MSFGNERGDELPSRRVVARRGRSPPCTQIGRYRREADKPGRELAVKSAVLDPEPDLARDSLPPFPQHKNGVPAACKPI
jgi:hypothetical protein